MSNPSHEPYLNSSTIIEDKGTKGCIVIRPIMAGGGGAAAEILGFSSYSGYSGGSVTVPPGQTTTYQSTDPDKNVSPDVEFNFQIMSPISYGVFFGLRWSPTSCMSDAIWPPCRDPGGIGYPECNAVHGFSKTWDTGNVTTRYFTHSGVSGILVPFRNVPIVGTAQMTAESKDDCILGEGHKGDGIGVAYYNAHGIATIQHSVVSSFMTSIGGISQDLLRLDISGQSGMYGTIDSPIQYPWVDSETLQGIESYPIGFLETFSGTSGYSGCSGFSGFSGHSGFSSHSGCSSGYVNV